MTTALDVITGAARLIGVAYKSEALSADEAADGLTALNDMLGTWSNDNLITYAFAEENFPLTSGTATYSIGSGQTFNTVRPITINYAYVRSGTIDYEVKIISPTEYDAITSKSVGGGIPLYLSYRNEYPNATLSVYPLPGSGYTLYLESNKPLIGPATLSTVFDFPPGWNRAVRFNLAVDLASEYGVPLPEQVPDIARKSLGAIKRNTSAQTGMPFRENSIEMPSVISGIA